MREGQLDGIRMGQQSVTITCVGKGRPQLQILKLLLFGGNRAANKKILHSAPSYTGKNKLVHFDGWQVGVVPQGAGQEFAYGKSPYRTLFLSRFPGNRVIRTLSLLILTLCSPIIYAADGRMVYGDPNKTFENAILWFRHEK